MLVFGVCALQPEPVVEVHFDFGLLMSFVKLRYCIQIVPVVLRYGIFLLLKVSALFMKLNLSESPFTI
jgi:hypothetical protein